jgi:peptidoglycan/xylan/chitin deacetylase (PgdA/CDA1 family)
MKFYWTKTPFIIKKWFSRYTWSLPKSKKVVYLTFDDGPTPEVTDWVLAQLHHYGVRATFFCIGKNIITERKIFNSILSKGHVVGNHTFNHMNGWKTSTANYIDNIQKDVLFSQEIATAQNNKYRKLFRPPYGKITSSQSRKLQSLGYKIMMWDVLSADFDTTITPEKCFENATKKIENGSIIIFHDSKKAFKNLEYALPKTLEFLKVNKFVCEVL